MGGKNPTIVLADADFNSAVENVVNAAFFSTGQKCTATSRAIVEDAIYDKFVAAVVERTRKLKVGDGMQPGIEIGPCVDQAQMETVLRYIEIGRKECGEPACGGRRLTEGGLANGYFVEPTVFAGVTEAHTIAREEIFGPVLAIMRATDFEDAMRIANAFPSDSPPPSRPPTSRAPSSSSIAPKPACSPSTCPARAWSTSFPSAAPRIPASVPRNRVRPRSNSTATTRPSI